MIRIAVIGPSHLAAWKLGWDQIASQYDDIELTFFGARGGGLLGLQLHDRRLVPSDPAVADEIAFTSRGKRDIAIDDYDVFCLVSLCFGDRPLVALYNHWRGDSHRCTDGEFVRISDRCFEAAARGLVSGAEGWRIARHLRDTGNKPIYLAPPPGPSDFILDNQFKNDNGYKLATASKDDAALRALFDSIYQSFGEADLVILKQPAATYATPLLTRRTFAVGARQLTGERLRRGDFDLFYMNAEFGIASLTEMLAHVRSTSAAAQAVATTADVQPRARQGQAAP